MCGIIGYIGSNECTGFLIDGLKKMEYRGYDSSGICVKNGSLTILKREGKISELEKSMNSSIKGNIGIAHTRWATHGEPNEKNSHPHMSTDGKIAIVHNGIIENYNSIKELLIEEGYKFVSETDSEVLAHLIDKCYNGDLEDAVTKALDNVEGTFGLAVIHEDEKKIVAARRGSPLILGVGENEMIIASDAVPIVSLTKKVVYLDDNEIAVIDKNSYKVKRLTGESVDREVQEIKWNIGEIEKKGYKHFMHKEIHEQPTAMENTIRGHINEGKIKLSVDIDVEKLERVVISACGTSWHSALIAKYYIEDIVDMPVEVDYASEFRYRNTNLRENDLFVVITQSGETADTLAALRKAKSSGCKTIGLVNVVGSTIAREVDSGIYLHAGPEIGVASTKAFLCQITGLLLLALYINQEKGGKNDPKLIEELEQIPSKIDEILKHEKDIIKIAEKLTYCRNFLYLGRGLNFPVALEGALKLKEISYIHAEGYPAAEMKHGPIALIDNEMPVVFIATEGKILDKVISNMEEVKARKGRVITITDSRDNKVKKLSEDILYIPKTLENLTPFLSSIPLQLLAYHIADMKGLNVDKPRNLAKSVTVE